MRRNAHRVLVPDAAWIRREVPVREVASALGLAGNSRYLVCWRCGKRKLGVHVRSNTLRCFRCSIRSLSPIDLASLVLGLETGATIRWLAQHFPHIPCVPLNGTSRGTPWPQPSVEVFVLSEAWPRLSHAAKALGCWLIAKAPRSPEVEPVLETTWREIRSQVGIGHAATIPKAIRELEEARLISFGVEPTNREARGFTLKRTVLRVTWAAFLAGTGKLPEAELAAGPKYRKR